VPVPVPKQVAVQALVEARQRPVAALVQALVA
jgi:hypothetical protein